MHLLRLFESFARRASMLCALLMIAAASPVSAATFVVTSKADPGDGICDATCTLREAIAAANALPGNDAINFAIAGKGELLIAPTAPLPTITGTLTINGFSQAGSSANTLASGSNALVRVRIDGAVAGGATAFGICANSVAVKGLSITTFQRGISFGTTIGGAPCASAITGGSASGNFIGLRGDGTTALGNGLGVFVANAQVVIGGNALADRNVIAASTAGGVNVFGTGASGSSVLNNLIGTDKSGTLARGNAVYGVRADVNVSGLTIGSLAAPNVLKYNGRGIDTASGAGSGNTWYANRVFDNDTLGVDIAGNGVTENDANDADAGANGLQNFPVLNAASRSETGLSVSGTLDISGSTLRTFKIALYASAACDALGNGEGERFLGVVDRPLLNPSIEAFTINLGTSDPLPPGTVITATATDPGGSTSEFSDCFPLDPNVLVVTSTADTDGSTCGATCTLRQALNAANAFVGGGAVINFNIPGSGPFTISPPTPLPAITGPVLIEGYSQPGAAANTLAVGDNAVIKIRLDGIGAGPNVTGLGICGSNTVVRGLSITRFQGVGIGIGMDTTSVTCAATVSGVEVSGNFIGLLPDGSAGGNAGAGVQGIRDTGTMIGGATAAQRNVVSANGSGVVFRNNFTPRRVDNNYIGTDPGGTLNRGNGLAGVAIELAASNVLVGSVAPNRIAFNARGIAVATNGGTGNEAFANELHSNDGLGIDLGALGVSLNDADDADGGPNALQNYPVIDRAVRSGGGLTMEGSLDVPVGAAGANYTIAVYGSASCDAPSGHGEGGRFLGRQSVSLTNSTAEGFVFDLATSDALPEPTHITATATDASGNTSEFSACVPATDPSVSLVVTSIADTGGNVCGATCTLRQAINAANLQPGADLISFDIAGAGPFTIQPATELPRITERVTIDGYTQLGSSPNALAQGNDAVLLIEIADLAPPALLHGLEVCAPDVALRGLSISGFVTALTTTEACGQPSPRLQLAGSFIGLRPDGTAGVAPNGGLRFNGAAHGSVIGGTSAADRNVISGTAALGGIRASGGTLSAGVVIGNYIGTDPSGTLPRPNSTAGITITGGEAIAIGGDGPGEPNLIAMNAGDGISLGTSGNVSWFGNDFQGNAGLAVDLDDNGVTANDANDADAGPNGLQNFPVLTGRTATAGSLTVEGLLDVPAALPSSPYRIALYDSPACDSPGGNGEGAVYLGSRTTLIGGAAESFSVTLDVPPPPASHVITATATDPAGNTSEFSACIPSVEPSPFLVVTSALDTDGTSCGPTCTLRQAINAANLQPGADQIRFNIPGGGPFTLTPATVLPTIFEAVSIDGYTQPGAAANSAATGSNAVLKIRLDGASAIESGLRICADDVTVRGLSITRFTGAGVRASDSGAFGCAVPGEGVRLLGNFLGLPPDGITPAGNGNGVFINGYVLQIGGVPLADRNVISANLSRGVAVFGAGSAGTVLLNNLIGRDAADTLARGNANSGVGLDLGATGVMVGTDAAPNFIRSNVTGVVAAVGTSGNSFYANHYSDSFALGINLLAGATSDGVTPNDANDGDAGANNLQNFPVLTARSQTAGSLTVQGTLDVPVATSNAAYRIALYASPACDTPAANGEGARFLGSQQVSLGGAAESFSVTVNGAPPAAGEVVTATATDPAGNTSEFSGCLAAAVVPPGETVFADNFE